MTDDEALRYPIGRFAAPPAPPSATDRASLVARLAALPGAVHEAVHGCTEAQLDTPYREGGWTVRQVVHHLADSHMNAYVRLKLGLTEDAPTIRPYDEVRWALLPEVARTPVATTVALLEALHARFAETFRAMADAEFARTIVHPADGVRRLDTLLAQYAWHGAHHVAQVVRLRERRGW